MRLVLSGRRPSLQKGNDIGRANANAVFEFALLLAVDHLAVGIEDGERRHAFVERDVVLCGKVESSRGPAERYPSSETRCRGRGSHSTSSRRRPISRACGPGRRSRAPRRFRSGSLRAGRKDPCSVWRARAGGAADSGTNRPGASRRSASRSPASARAGARRLRTACPPWRVGRQNSCARSTPREAPLRSGRPADARSLEPWDSRCSHPAP